LGHRCSSRHVTYFFLLLACCMQPELRCDYFHLNVANGAGNGETLTRVPLTRHDLILADAGYCSVPWIPSVARQGAGVLVRLNPQLPLLNRRGRFSLLPHLQELRTAGTAREWPVRLPGRIDGRVCALRKSEAAVGRAHRRLERRATKQQSQIKADTWEYAKYVLIFTTGAHTFVQRILVASCTSMYQRTTLRARALSRAGRQYREAGL
jgi:hypothetical protein